MRRTTITGPLAVITLAAGALLVAPATAAGAATTVTAAPTGTGLRAAIRAGATVPRTGDPGTIAIDVTNDAGAAPATSVVLSLSLGDGLLLAPTAAGAAPCTTKAADVTCPVGTVAPGASATVLVGLRAGPGASRSIRVRPPTSAQWDPLAGEILAREWDHEAGAQGAPLLACWPFTADGPFDQVTSSRPADCGVRETETGADRSTVVAAMPGPFSQPVVRSWEWRATVRTAADVTVRACLAGIDDGGAVGLDSGPGTPVRPILEVDEFTPGLRLGAPIVLRGGVAYELVVRVANRGDAGPDNGGAYPGGWSALGLTTSDQCSAVAVSALVGTASETPTGTVADVTLAPAADLSVVGNGSGPLPNGRRWAQARVVNRGPDRARATVTYDAPAGWTATQVPAQCAPPAGSGRVRCDMGELDAGGSALLDFVLERSAAATALASPSWAATSSVDEIDPAGNLVPAGW